MNGVSAESPMLPELGGKCVLLVEDEYLLAEDLALMLKRRGARVIGPYPTVAETLTCLATGPTLDFALLDVNLRGEMVFPIADRLRASRVPFIFVTGYDPSALPPDYRMVPRLEKPLELL